MTVYAPNALFTGIRNGVVFTNGIGNTDDFVKIQWFKESGYNVGGAAVVDNTVAPTNTQLEDKTYEELKEIAKELKIKAFWLLSRENLIEKIRQIRAV